MSGLCIRWPKYWSFSFSISPSNECSGLVSFRIDLLAAQGTLKSLLLLLLLLLPSHFRHVHLCVTPETAAHQAPPSLGFSRQEHWSGSPLQHHNSKLSLLWLSALIVHLSHLYMTTGKTIALTVWTFVGKITSLLFNTPFRFVIAFLPGSRCLLISSLQSPSTLILEPKKIKSATVSTVSPSICHEMMGPDAMIFVF